ncbi:hypothetical protein [Aquirufa nivalisilvae]
MFKTLANLFSLADQGDNSSQKEENKNVDGPTPGDEDSTQTTEDANEQEDESADANESNPAEASLSSLPAEASIVSPERLASLLAAESELKSFGATREQRTAFLAEAKQLHTWHKNLVSLGIKGVKSDASSEGNKKPKYESAVTRQAKQKAGQ